MALWIRVNFGDKRAAKVVKHDTTAEPYTVAKSYLPECVPGKGWVSAFSEDPRTTDYPNLYGTVRA
jgi:hypothetical protein